jgi:hypothetical protein
MLAWLIYNHTANSSYLVEPSPTLHPLLVVAITSDEELAKLAKKKNSTRKHLRDYQLGTKYIL